MSTLPEPAYPLVDLALAQRLERAEARANVDFVEARACLQPQSGAAWIEVAGAYAMFDGVDSPLTQSFGLGLFEPVTARELERLEAFFAERGAPVHHEISPLADPGLLPLLAARGYLPIELSSVLYGPIAALAGNQPTSSGDLRVRLCRPTEEDLWARTAARGWSEAPELSAFMLEFGRITTRTQQVVCFLAELKGRPIAAAALSISGGVALLAGASTVPEARNRGAQSALLCSRLRFAAEHGCDLAMLAAQPGSASQRNAERRGFRIAYTRIKWRRAGHVPAAHPGT